MTHEEHHYHEHCECGHDHEHHHHHDEHCGCGHDHHHHDEHCDCGHDHDHHHDESCGCGHDHHELGQICTQVRLHDDAKVVSGHLELMGSYSEIRERLRTGMEEFAAKVAEQGGVVGHIKASAQISQVEMFSVTDVEVMIKSGTEDHVTITLAAIVFFISEQEAEHLAQEALAKALGE